MLQIGCKIAVAVKELEHRCYLTGQWQRVLNTNISLAKLWIRQRSSCGILQMVYISWCLILLPRTSKVVFLDIGVLVIIVIYNLFLWLLFVFFFLQGEALSVSFCVIKKRIVICTSYSVYPLGRSSHTCFGFDSNGTKKSVLRLEYVLLVSLILLCVSTCYICVARMCLPLQGGVAGTWGRRERWGWAHLLGSSWCSRNLSSSLFRQWRGTCETLAHGD